MTDEQPTHDEQGRRLVPQPSAAEGWYVSVSPGPRVGYTSDPRYARLVPVCGICDTYHKEPEGTCLL